MSCAAGAADAKGSGTVNVSRKRLVADLSKLVRIPSWEECETIGRHLVDQLRREGFSGARTDAAGNVVVTLGRGGPG